MPIKNILVHVDASEDSAMTVKVAASLARKFDAGLSGFFVLPDVAVAAAVPSGAVMSPQIVEDMQKNAEEHAASAERIFREAAGELALNGKWICADGLGVGTRTAAARVAFYADLVVAGRLPEDDKSRYGGFLSQDLVVDSGRPLLLVPPNAPTDLKADKVVVAWSESREAARAVFDALPLLMSAETVTIVSIVDKGDDAPAPGRKIADVLADHGIEAAVETVAVDGGTRTSEALFDFTQRNGADLLVAGAYSHSRLLEGIFGGVTKSLFDSTPLPAFLSH